MVGKCRATKLHPSQCHTVPPNCIPSQCRVTELLPQTLETFLIVSNRTTSTSVQGTLVRFFPVFALIILSIFKDLFFIMGEYVQTMPTEARSIGGPPKSWR